MKILRTLSEWMYNWVFTKSSSCDDYHQMYHKMDPNHLNGMGWGLVILLAVSLIAVIVYYHVVASNLKNATSSNYLLVYAFGYLTLFVMNAFVLPRLTGFEGNVWTLNLLKFNLMGFVYYTLFFELWSLILMATSKDNQRELINTVFKQ